MGILVPIFLIFDPKHRLWVLVRTTSARGFKRVPTIYVLSKYIKNIKVFLMKFSIFTAEKIICILYGQVFVMSLMKHQHGKSKGILLITKLILSTDNFCLNFKDKSLVSLIYSWRNL